MKAVQGFCAQRAERVTVALLAHVCPAYQAGPLCVCCTGALNSHASVHEDKGQA